MLIDYALWIRGTYKRLKEIANSIHPSIRVTIDCPSLHEDGRLPVLDLAQWIEERDIDGRQVNQIMHSHYMKPMANRFVIRKDSAQSIKAKTNILVSDLVRIMRNVSRVQQTTKKETGCCNYSLLSGVFRASETMAIK